MHTLKFFNIGNADSILVGLANGKRILLDYANCRDPNDPSDLRCDLAKELREDLGTRATIEVVAFTHLDRDHYAGATDLFYFDHIAEYQGDIGGKPRVRMETLWVPAAILTEELSHEAPVEAKAIQREARERFRAKSAIRVFSRPERLHAWCVADGIRLDARRHLVTDAGHLAPGFSREQDGVEVFVHSPFAVRQADNSLDDRNGGALGLHATFFVGGRATRAVFASDLDHEALAKIVEASEKHSNYDRLKWDVFKLPHHCSHHSLSARPREGDKSVPEPLVARLFEHYGETHSIVVSPSNRIPPRGSQADRPGSNPPHCQAANYYQEDVRTPKDGEFKVTMCHPTESKPSPLVIRIDAKGATVEKQHSGGSGAAVAVPAPRAGR